MNKPLVSICIPVYNGQRFLVPTLESLINQDYENIEIIILDNLSEDDTENICRSFVDRCNKVRYIKDNKRVSVSEGVKRVFQHAKGTVFMVACDDDIYLPCYVSKLMSIMHSNPDVGLVYSGMGYVNEDGVKSLENIPERYFFRSRYSKLYNYARYLLFRCPVPSSFGLIRADLHREAIKYYYRVDHRGWDHDNLFMLRLLSLAKVESTKEVFFYYRQRDRSEQLSADRPKQYLRLYIYLMRHQILFSKAVAGMINQANFHMVAKAFLQSWNIIVLVYVCTLRLMFTWLKSGVKRIICSTRIEKIPPC